MDKLATALNYTFSTIAQSLAAAMALLAAFAMYRLKGFSDDCGALGHLMESETGGGTYLRAYCYVGDWRGMLAAQHTRLEQKRAAGGQYQQAEYIRVLPSRIAMLIGM